MAVLIWAIPATVGVLALIIIAFAIWSERSHRRRRRGLVHMSRSPAADIAYRAVVNARAAFTRSVQAYEEAIASAGASAGSSSVMAGESQTTADLQVMERRKDSRRTRLFDAQRRWESVRPSPGPDSDVEAWIGAGELRGWSLGLVGHETLLLRIEHAIDPGCWVVLETRRFRLGPAVGAERLKLGLMIEGADISQLTEIMQVAMGSPEVALRPGTSFARMLSRRRVGGRPLFDALRQDVTGGSRLYVKGIGAEPRQLALAYLASDRGIDLDASNGVSPRFERLALRITSNGPSLLIGAWLGRRPSARVVAGSNHQAWVRSR